MPARVLLLSPWDPAAVRGWLEDHAADVVTAPDPPAQDALLALAPEADLVISDNRHRHRLDRPVLERLVRCRLIQVPAVGFDAIDHRVAAELGIPVANAAGYNRDAVADWVIMAMLNLLRRGAYGDRRMRDGAWPAADLIGRELGYVTVGIVGLGNVGSAVAARLSGFGTRVLFTDVAPKGFLGARQVSLAQLLAESDVVTVHTPLDHDTRGLIGADALARMKPGALLVSAARGPVLDERAVIEALRSGRLAGAALDVYEVEPLASDSPLRSMENVFLSPHVGGATEQARTRVQEVVRANLRRVLAGEDAFNVVNGVSRRQVAVS
ncbi:MAG TPA: NAD(P)-dependent oxidoreductase [Candidatus Dormibacteraeota bacterium]